MVSSVTSVLSDAERRDIARAVEHFRKSRDQFENMAKSLVEHFLEDPALGNMIHFIKHRVKKEQSLQGKLERLALAKGTHELTKPTCSRKYTI